MARNIFPIYQEDDPVYISAFGMETEWQKARWGPGRRTEGIVHYVLRGEGVFNGHLVRENQGFYISPNSFCEYYSSEEIKNYLGLSSANNVDQYYARAKKDMAGLVKKFSGDAK